MGPTPLGPDHVPDRLRGGHGGVAVARPDSVRRRTGCRAESSWDRGRVGTLGSCSAMADL